MAEGTSDLGAVADRLGVVVDRVRALVEAQASDG